MVLYWTGSEMDRHPPLKETDQLRNAKGRWRRRKKDEPTNLATQYLLYRYCKYEVTGPPRGVMGVLQSGILRAGESRRMQVRCFCYRGSITRRVGNWPVSPFLSYRSRHWYSGIWQTLCLYITSKNKENKNKSKNRLQCLRAWLFKGCLHFVGS